MRKIERTELKRKAKEMHLLKKAKGLKSSIAQCHHYVALKYGYNSYNHYLEENK